jgi:membrane carboxypeptidase/penicillin-binding protein
VDVFFVGFLQIYTTLDLHMQTFAEMVIEEEMNNRDIHRKSMRERLRKAHNKKMKGDAQRVDCE